MADWREEAERWWAAVLGLPVTAFRVGGIFPASGFDHLGVLTVPGAAAPVVYGPVSSVPVLHALQELAAATGGLDTSDLDAVPGLRAGRVVGLPGTGTPPPAACPRCPVPPCVP